MAILEILPNISLDEDELSFEFVTSSGPGGQNVNKLATCVQLRFDLGQSSSLPEYVKSRLALLAKNRINNDGVLIIKAQRFRSQIRNREDAVERLISMIIEAARVPEYRRPTRPSRASIARVKQGKSIRSNVKSLRRKIDDEG